MAVIPLKFRCFQCNQLLGVSRSKIGAVVTCPKCQVDLIVPDPDEADRPAVEEGLSPAESAPLGEEYEEGISLDLLDIRPEDIRVEPGASLTPPPARPPREPFPIRPPAIEPQVSPVSTQTAPAPLNVEELVGPTSQAEAIVPPIELEPTRVAEPRAMASRSRDVVLPRSAVAAWSLFVLLAQALAFVAGLLAGHFLWRVH